VSRGPRFSESPGASAAYRLTAEKLAERLGVDPSRGLSGDEARRRRRRHGANRLEQRRRGGAWRILVAQFKSLVVLLLLAASVTAAAFGRHVEAVAVAAALALNAVIGFGTELQAVRSMDALRGLGQARARVWRDGEESDLPAAQLVPGDVVLLKEGNVVPADLRLLSVENLQCNESALTGESEPVTKSVHALEDGDVPLAERANMAFKGTAVTRGAATGLVTATGRDTEVGRISRMVEEAEEAATPLERRLDRLGRRLIFLVLGVGALVAVSGLAAGKPLFVMVETSLALGVGADDPRALKRPPRDPAEAILTRRHWSAISGFGVALGGSVLVVFVAALKVYGLEVEEAVTVAFLAYGLARLWHVFNMRSPDSGIFVNEVVRNPWVWAAAGVCTLLLGAAVVVPGLARLLDVEPLSAVGWALVAAGSLAPLLLGQMGLVVVGLWLRRRVRESAPAGG
jgi:magnesium-transporting ATPase (P-type)